MRNLKLLIPFFAIFMSISSVKGQDNKENKTPEWVLINGIKWATCNVESSGKFVSSPYMYDEYFSWEEAKNACPSGWRLPTLKEFKGLLTSDKYWGQKNGVNGYFFGTVPNQVFFPATGYCADSLYDQSDYGNYWSSTPKNSRRAWYLLFGSFGTGCVNIYRYVGFPVRCVAE